MWQRHYLSRAAKHLLLVNDDWFCHIFHIALYHCSCKHHSRGVCSGNSASNQCFYLLILCIFWELLFSYNVHSINNNSSEFIISKSFKSIQLLVDNVHVLSWYGNHLCCHSKCWWQCEAFMFPNTYFILTHPYMLWSTSYIVMSPLQYHCHISQMPLMLFVLLESGIIKLFNK